MVQDSIHWGKNRAVRKRLCLFYWPPPLGLPMNTASKQVQCQGKVKSPSLSEFYSGCHYLWLLQYVGPQSTSAVGILWKCGCWSLCSVVLVLVGYELRVLYNLVALVATGATQESGAGLSIVTSAENQADSCSI
jgi:hypothetical protein